MLLEPDQRVHLVFIGEAFNEVMLVLVHSARQVAGDTDVKCAVRLTSHDINVGTFDESHEGYFNGFPPARE